MRVARFVCLALALAFLPANAHADGKPILGSYTCPQRVPCPSDASLTTEQWALYGNSCVTTAFGYTNPSGFIDPSAGLDSNGCLSALSGSIPKGMGSQLTPRCCVVERQPNSCVIHCDLVP